MSRLIIALTAIVICVAVCGCTEAERRGYSTIPHSSPASWEVAPYGDMRN